MLEPVYFGLPPNTRLYEGDRYVIRGYARFERWTLVLWRIDCGIEPIYGETLWRDRAIVSSGSGASDIWEPPVPREPLDPDDPPPPPPPLVENPFDRIAANYGRYGMTDVVAVALRDPANCVWFDLD